MSLREYINKILKENLFRHRKKRRQ